MGIFGSWFEKRLVGLDIGVSGIKAVELSGRADAPRLAAYNRIPLPWEAITPEGEIKKRDAVVKALKKLFDSRAFSSKFVAVGASGNAIITKKISVPKMSEAELREQLYWEAEQYIPFPVNDVNLDFAIIGNSQNTSPEGAALMDVLLVAAKKEYIQSMAALIQEAGLIPKVIDNQSFALGNSFEFNYGVLISEHAGMSTNVIIDFGAGSTKLSIVEGDKTTFTRDLPQSGIGCTLLLSERLGISIEDAERLKIQQPDQEAVEAVLHDYNRGVVDEIGRTLDYAISANSESGIQGIYLCGGASRTLGLIEMLADSLPAPVRPLNPVQGIAGTGRKMSAQAIRELSYLGAVAIGLALRIPGDTR